MSDRLAGAVVASGLLLALATIASPSVIPFNRWVTAPPTTDPVQPPSHTRPPVSPPAPGGYRAGFPADHIHAVDAALANHDVSGAVRGWHDLWGAALASLRWDAMIAAGDAFLRIGEAAGAANAAKPNARQAYLTALMRARRDGAVDGALLASVAFARIGDRDVARQCLRVVASLAATNPDPGPREQVKAVADALESQWRASGQPDG